MSDNFEVGAGVAVAEAPVCIFECVGSAIVIKSAREIMDGRSGE